MSFNKFIITTTGTLSSVPLEGLGKVPGYTHPTTTDLLEEFTLQEVQDVNSTVQDALDAGYITATNESGAKIVNILNDTTPALIKNNLSGTTVPGAGVDSTSGYSIGSLWIDVTNDNAYFCTDNTSGAAVWKSTTESSVDNSAEIAYLSGVIDDNTSDITTISGDVTNLEGDVSNLSGNIDYLSAQISGLTGDYVTLDTEQTITANKIFDGDLRVNGTFTALSSVVITTEEFELSSNFITLNTNVTGAPTEDAGIAVSRGTSANSVLLWNESLDRWEIGISGDTKRILDNDDYISINSDIFAVSAAVTNIEGDVATISGDLDTLEGDVTDILTDITNLSSAIDDNEAGITYLSGIIDGHDASINTLSSQITFLSGTIDTVSGDLDTLEATVGPLSSGTYIGGTTVAGDLVILDTELAALSAEVANVENNHIFTFSASRNSANASNLYLRGPGNTPTNQSGFLLPYDATLIAITAKTGATETWTAEIRKNGNAAPIASVGIAAATSGVSNALSIDVNEGDEIQMYCNGTNINRPHIMAYFKRR